MKIVLHTLELKHLSKENILMDEKLFKGKGIHLFHLNIRSLFCKNKFDMFKQQMSHSDADIKCLSETWLKKGLTSNIINIPGYRLTRLDRNWIENKSIKKKAEEYVLTLMKILFLQTLMLVNLIYHLKILKYNGLL